ncbi:MAG: prolyl oligopeptidase family serine peptidase [Rikenellaceae bacterium]
MINKFIVSLLVTVAVFTSLHAQKRALSDDDYALWRRVDSYTLSPDGRFVTYKYSYLTNDEKNKECEDTYYLFDNVTRKNQILKGVSDPSFQANGRWLLFDQDGKAMLMRMKDGKKIEWKRNGSPSFDFGNSKVTYNSGNNLVIYDLEQGDSIVFEGVKRANFYNKGSMMLYLKDSDLYYGKTSAPKTHRLLYRDTTKQLKNYHFSSQEAVGSFQVAGVLYKFNLNGGTVTPIIDKRDIQLESPLYVSEGGFAKQNNDRYITFDVYSSNLKEPKKYDKSKQDNSFELELWSWNDSITQSVQAKGGYRAPKQQAFIYVYDMRKKTYYPLIDSPYSAFYMSTKKDGEYAFYSDDYKYNKNSDWEHDQRADIYLVSLSTGEKRLIKERTSERFKWSQNGDYIVFFDAEVKAWFSLEPKSFTLKNLTESIGHPMHDITYDKPNSVPAYGIAGWTKDGNSLVIYDQYDIWVVSVSGERAPYCYTNSYGRKNNKILRFVNPEFNDLTIDLTKKQKLEVCDIATMNQGVATRMPDGKIIQNIEGDFNAKILKMSDNSTVYLYHKQSFGRDRDLWIADSNFKQEYRITESNPQQKEYSWGRCEIVQWTNYDGQPNRGLLYLPENYQQGKSYPAIVNFYETHTAERHIYYAPSYSSAMLNVAMYVSNGYIVFMPDITFKIGEPGKSSYNCAVSGTKALIERGILDSMRIGLQGHSWSGYQTAYLVTRTNLFKCANAGAAIVNMTSGYNGLREGSGAPRMFMYEDWQCRMGATMWEALDQYIESSPILYADKINTPLLLFHCDKDEAVSFYEGRSLFLALRRLQKPAWLLNYKGEGHFVNKIEAKADWTKRMRQFFDYYLNDTPMPRWLAEGININERGYDQKLDLLK